MFAVSRSGTVWEFELMECFKQFPACSKLLELRRFWLHKRASWYGNEMKRSKTTDVVKQIKRATRKKVADDEKIRVVIEGLRGEISISEVTLNGKTLGHSI
jgi:hypothetical protein